MINIPCTAFWVPCRVIRTIRCSQLHESFVLILDWRDWMIDSVVGLVEERAGSGNLFPILILLSGCINSSSLFPVAILCSLHSLRSWTRLSTCPLSCQRRFPWSSQCRARFPPSWELILRRPRRAWHPRWRLRSQARTVARKWLQTRRVPWRRCRMSCRFWPIPHTSLDQRLALPRDTRVWLRPLGSHDCLHKLENFGWCRDRL